MKKAISIFLLQIVLTGCASMSDSDFDEMTTEPSDEVCYEGKICTKKDQINCYEKEYFVQKKNLVCEVKYESETH